MNINKFLILAIVVFAALSFSCSKTETLTPTEYAQACKETNKDKEIAVQGFIQAADKVPCMNMLNPKRDCAFKFLDKANVSGSEIIAYLPEGADKNHAETPEAGKSAFESKPSSVFTRDQIKIRLNDGTLIVPQADVATPVIIAGKITLTDKDTTGGEKICSIMATKIEKK